MHMHANLFRGRLVFLFLFCLQCLPHSLVFTVTVNFNFFLSSFPKHCVILYANQVHWYFDMTKVAIDTDYPGWHVPGNVVPAYILEQSGLEAIVVSWPIFV